MMVMMITMMNYDDDDDDADAVLAQDVARWLNSEALVQPFPTLLRCHCFFLHFFLDWAFELAAFTSLGAVPPRAACLRHARPCVPGWP